MSHPRDRAGRDPYALFGALHAANGVRHDPCVLDVFMSAVRCMEGSPAHEWWHYTDGRNAHSRRGRTPAP